MTTRTHDHVSLCPDPSLCLANVRRDPGGPAQLKSAGCPIAGQAKCEWARNITPHVDVNRNRSKSSQVFRDGVRSLAGI